MTNNRLVAQPTGDERAPGTAVRFATNPKFRGTPPAPRSMKTSPIEDVRLWQLPYVAILSLVLVALLQVVQAGVLLSIGEPFGLPELTRDFILRTPWSILVCVAVWSGLVYGRGSAAVTGLVAAVSAPVASLVAHALAETGASVGLSAVHEMLVSPYLVAAQKGVAYAVLALLVLWLWARRRATAWHHAAAGLVVGLLFGGALLLLEAQRGMGHMTAAILVAGVVNEVLFPIGCAVLLWHARARTLAVDKQSGGRGLPWTLGDDGEAKSRAGAGQRRGPERVRRRGSRAERGWPTRRGARRPGAASRIRSRAWLRAT